MALNGIPISDDQCIGDSLVTINNAFVSLDIRTSNTSVGRIDNSIIITQTLTATNSIVQTLTATNSIECRGGGAFASNLAIGEGALVSNTTGLDNTAIGGRTLNLNLTGYDNTAIGNGALLTNNGRENTGCGNDTLRTNTTGDYNTALGTAALYSNTTGDFNTASGRSALLVNTTGYENTAVGRSAGSTNTTGYNNTFIGSGARGSSVSATNQIVIGQGIVGVGNSYVSIGNSTAQIYNNYASNNTWVQSSDERLKKDIQDDVVGLSFIKKLRPVTYKLKPSNELDSSMAEYQETNQVDSELLRRGFIAQEVKSAITAENVQAYLGWDEQDSGTQGVGSGAFISPLINAVKELSKQVEDLKAEIENIKNNK